MVLAADRDADRGGPCDDEKDADDPGDAGPGAY